MHPISYHLEGKPRGAMAALARALKISKGHLHDIASGRRQPGRQVGERIAKYFGCSMAVAMGLEVYTPPPKKDDAASSPGRGRSH